MSGWSVVVHPNGIPVQEVPNGTPIEISPIGAGVLIRYVVGYGTPVTTGNYVPPVVTPPGGFTPALRFNDARNSMYVLLLGAGSLSVVVTPPIVIPTGNPSLKFNAAANSQYLTLVRNGP